MCYGVGYVVIYGVLMKYYCVLFRVLDDVEWCCVKASSEKIAVWKVRKFYISRFGSFYLLDVFKECL